jgi:eukaryotic-like serine/threonine-protein kinase
MTAFGTHSIESTESAAGTVIGPYRLLELLVRAAWVKCGWPSRSSRWRRRVAIKLIKAGMHTREVVERFESERQALALMDHPTIAKVFDAGSTPEGDRISSLSTSPESPSPTIATTTN